MSEPGTGDALQTPIGQVVGSAEVQECQIAQATDSLQTPVGEDGDGVHVQPSQGLAVPRHVQEPVVGELNTPRDVEALQRLKGLPNAPEALVRDGLAPAEVEQDKVSKSGQSLQAVVPNLEVPVDLHLFDAFGAGRDRLQRSVRHLLATVQIDPPQVPEVLQQRLHVGVHHARDELEVQILDGARQDLAR
eukprot:CAMPEP_0198463180 /NCGR_PEP_ID=MMETSP1456-20131121/1555_1 /TAXON_ID=1461544 ORGANISM="Unidentified sp., Strain RCC1871" /NCGR_SAMPLE_ID=MMETSP1456 /ASSEMBLY_ACC=CAM_ASM_001119 /LENGTH=189 /DNA_ID=CAMNT_0044188563 /DNA_START=848 /DNA_END=1415 /DNA_ORIENTATION=-